MWSIEWGWVLVRIFITVWGLSFVSLAEGRANKPMPKPQTVRTSLAQGVDICSLRQTGDSAGTRLKRNIASEGPERRSPEQPERASGS